MKKSILCLTAACMALSGCLQVSTLDETSLDHAQNVILELGEACFIKARLLFDETADSVADFSGLTIQGDLVDSSEYVYDADSGWVTPAGGDYLDEGEYPLELCLNGVCRQIQVVVQDTTGPVFSRVSDAYYTEKNKEFLLSNQLKIQEKNEYELLVYSDLDTSQPGIYDCLAVASDAAGNQSSVMTKVYVIDPYNPKQELESFTGVTNLLEYRVYSQKEGNE